jgi:hypothetical protein
MSDAKVNKTYVRPDNTAVLTCPACGSQRTITIDSVNEHKSTLRVKCGCENVFTVNLEFRKRIRKRTHLRGTYVNHSQNEKSGNIIVTNVSISGLEFTSVDVATFKVDDELTLEFTLDDEHRSEIRKEAVVTGVRSKSVGCEFPGAGEYAYDGALGFYIRS